MEYNEIKRIASRIVPGDKPLIDGVIRKAKAVREKGRKSNYSQFNLVRNRWEKQERLLKTDQIDSFLEISLRAVGCPMPFNMDVWDGLKCPFRCIYCFPSGTKILMVDGSKKVIERVRKGDRVMSFNETTQDIEPAEVMKTMNRIYKKELICIETEDGQILKMTPEHPVFTQRGWTEAKELGTEDEVLIW